MVMRVMSTAGPMKNSSAGTYAFPRRSAMTMAPSSATTAGATSEGDTAIQRAAPNRQCSRFWPCGVSA